MKGIVWSDRGIICSQVYFGLCIDAKTYAETLDLHEVPFSNRTNFLKTEHSDATTHFYNAHNGRRVALVCLNAELSAKHTPIQVAGLLIHEGVHIWQDICEYMGEDAPSIEFEAYSIQWITQELMEAWVEMTVKNRKRKKTT